MTMPTCCDRPFDPLLFLPEEDQLFVGSVKSVWVTRLIPILTMPTSVIPLASGAWISSNAAASMGMVQPPAMPAGKVYPTMGERGRSVQSSGLSRSGFSSGTNGTVGTLVAGVTVIVPVLVGVKVAVTVTVPVLVGVEVALAVDVTVEVFVGVWVGEGVDVAVGVFVGVLVAVFVGVLVGVFVAVLVGVLVEVLVGVTLDVLVCVGVAVDVAVLVRVNVGLARGAPRWIMIFTATRVLFGSLAGETTVTYAPSPN